MTLRIVAKWKAKFEAALTKELRLFAQAVQNGDGRNFANTRVFSESIFNTLQALYQDVGVKFAKLNYDTLRKEKLLMGSNEEWFKIILDYLGQNFYNNGVYQIVRTNQKTYNAILDKAIQNGWGVDETVKYILNDDKLGALTAFKAERIARTETGKAIHAGTYVGADRSPFVKEKMWIAARDNRTRGNPFNDRTPQDESKRNPDHYYMDGQTVEFGKKFTDPRSGVELEHPHDPTAPGKDVINCRCTYAVVNKRDANGRLIRKPQGINVPSVSAIPTVRQVPVPTPPQPTKPPQFVPAKTIKEAEQWAKQNLNVKFVSFKGLDVGVANDINKSVFDIKAVMPDIRTNGIGSAQEANKAAKAKIIEAYKRGSFYTNVRDQFGEKIADKSATQFANRVTPKVGPRTIAWSANRNEVKVPGGETVDLSEFVGVFVNQSEGKNKARLDMLIKQNRDTKWFTESASDFGYVMHHEIGHEIDKTIGFVKFEEFVKIYERENALGVEHVTNRLSKYAATAGGRASHKPAEMIAESWAEFMTSKNPRELSKEIGELMLRTYYNKNTSTINKPYNEWYSEILKIVKQ